MISRPIAVLAALVLLAGCATAGDPGRVAEASHRADLHARLAATYLERGQFDVAREEINKALAADPNSSHANHVMAVFQARLGEDRRADEHFRRALRADSENYDAMLDYGLFLCAGGQEEAGIRQLKRLTRAPANTRPAFSHAALGECHVRANDPVAAEEAYRGALTINPRQATALIGMARLMLEQDNALSARAHLQRYFEVGPITADSLGLGYRIETRLGAEDLAAEYGLQLRRDFPDSPEARELRRAD
jgi:type IV pilus assembly protein PilF